MAKIGNTLVIIWAVIGMTAAAGAQPVSYAEYVQRCATVRQLGIAELYPFPNGRNNCGNYGNIGYIFCRSYDITEGGLPEQLIVGLVPATNSITNKVITTNISTRDRPIYATNSMGRQTTRRVGYYTVTNVIKSTNIISIEKTFTSNAVLIIYHANTARSYNLVGMIAVAQGPLENPVQLLRPHQVGYLGRVYNTIIISKKPCSRNVDFYFWDDESLTFHSFKDRPTENRYE